MDISRYGQNCDLMVVESLRLENTSKTINPIVNQHPMATKPYHKMPWVLNISRDGDASTAWDSGANV